MTIRYLLLIGLQVLENWKEEKNEYENFNEDCSGVYIGETSRNIVTRSTEHNAKYLKKTSDSFIL